MTFSRLSFLRRVRERGRISAAAVAGLALLAGMAKVTPARAPRGTPSAAQAAPATSVAVDFARDIAPILKANCQKCHGADDPQGKLRLDSEAGVLRGGASGKAVVPGNSGDSRLVKRLMGRGDAPRMPLGGDPLPTTQINLIRSWIDQLTPEAAEAALRWGAPVPAHAESVVTVAAQASGDYATKVRPIFAARCYQCHGPSLQQNGLRLDSLAAILKGSANAKVVVPGDSERSPLMRRLLALDRPQMPYGGPPLSADEIGLIRSWIDRGAPGPDTTEPVAAAGPVKHWAFVKPVRPEIPAVKNPGWCRNPIDNFVLARLEKEGLPPSPEAPKETLIRRVYLDLVGVPPSPKEVDAFLADKSPEAYEKVVDRLLASAHYGERWARPWLDMARYADTQGYEKDEGRVAWEYRDWVIKALNEDMSFREFTLEQIAGDMLPNPTTDQLIATGFHRNTMLNQEGGVDHEEYRWYSLIDRVNTTATVWLGLTLGCAQCHNHKFDPFTQKEYYQFLAFFDNVQYKDLNLGQGEGWVEEPELELPTPEQAKKASEIRAQIADAQKVLDTETPELAAAQAKWEGEMKAAEDQWTVLVPDHFTSEGGATLKLLPDHSLLAGGKNPQADSYTVEARSDVKGITGVRLEVLSDASLPNGGPGRDADGNFYLSDFEEEARPPDGAAEKVKLQAAEADEAQGGYEIKRIIGESKDEEEAHGWAINDSLSSAVKRRQAVLVPEKPFGFGPGTVLTFQLKHRMRHATRNIGRFRLSVTTMPDPIRTVAPPARLRPVLDLPAAQRSPEQTSQLAAAYRSIAPLLQPTRDHIKELNADLGKVGIATALIVRERADYERPSTYLHIRGAFLSKGDKVYADVPRLLNPLPPDAMPNRLGLAEWLVSDDNPLTARVTVNHFWQEIFGRGIVETAEDFGTQGEPPSHPEMLDWLATEFMRQGWSMKKIIRLMVTSATYRQSSSAAPELIERDPYNRLLARGPRFRAEGEMVRDIALEASGLLSSRMFGPSVFPYQPEGVWDRPYSDEKWVMSEGEERYRRGIYTYIRRTAAYPSLLTFDAPTREFCTIRRPRTNTPLQALTTLNDPVFFGASRALARRIEKGAGPDPAAGITLGFRLCTARRPNAAELERLKRFYHLELERYTKDPKAALDVLTPPGPDPSQAQASTAVVVPSPREAAERAAWTMVANVLLNLDETITKE